MFQDHPRSSSAGLGTELERARLARRMTQRGLAARAGVGRVTLANLERGQGSVAALVRVLAILEHRFIDQPANAELGPWLAQRRKQAGLSQDRLCALARVSKPALVKVEHGRGHASTLVIVMNALGLSLAVRPVDTSSGARPRPAPTAHVLGGDCREHMRAMAREHARVDAIVTDPPYHLSSVAKRFGRRSAAPLTGGEPGSNNPYRAMATGFMGQEWDGSGVAFDAATWRAAFEVLKPGGYLVAFGGSRTFHRLAMAIEDAGFEVRDTIMWVYGSGFPKSHNVGRGIEGLKRGNSRYNGRTMPSQEAASRSGRLLQEMGTGDWTGRSVAVADPEAQLWEGHGTALKPAYEPILIARKPISEASVAANVLRHGTGSLNIDACRVPTEEVIEQGRAGRKLGASVALMGRGLPPTPSQRRRESARRSGNAPGRPGEQGATITNRISPERYMAERPGESLGRWPANLIHDGSIEETWGRYFYSAKASTKDRGSDNRHPTVKPNDLMRYLVRLVTPSIGTVYDPFLGSGSTGVAALQEGFDFIGSEKVTEYVEIAQRRIGAVGHVMPVELAPTGTTEVA